MSAAHAKSQALTAARCAAILSRGAEETAREWTRLAGQRRDNGLAAFAALMRCRTPGDFLVAQADVVGGQLELVREASERLSEIVAAAAGEAARALETEAADI